MARFTHIARKKDGKRILRGGITAAPVGGESLGACPGVALACAPDAPRSLGVT